MPVNWMDVSNLSFNTLLLLETVQLSWLPGWAPEPEMALALRANPAVEWYLRHKCPALAPWLDQLLAIPSNPPTDSAAVRQAEQKILRALNDLVVYALDPAVYDAQPFLQWDSAELTSLADFRGKTVIDVGAGTGRLAFVAAPHAQAVFAVEPVGKLRQFLKEKARQAGLNNVYPVDGVITDIPLPDGFAGVTLTGHVFGDHPEEEHDELFRVTARGGLIVLCPGNNDSDNPIHQFLLEQGYQWSRLEEPEDGTKRKYWLHCA